MNACDTAAMTAEGHDSEELSSWAEAALGGRTVEWRQLIGGNSRTTYLAAVETPAETIRLVVRAERGDGPFSDTELTLEREARMYRAVEGSGVAVPRLLAVAEDAGAIALSRVSGSEDWSERVLDDLLAEIAKLHRADPTAAQAAGFEPRALADLELWEGIAAAKITTPSPYLEFAFDFLRRHFPGEPERIVICHGDVGPGNVLHDGERLTGLLDWEFSHLGDPIDDLAWITVRGAMFGVDVPDFGARVRAHYAAAAEVELDPGRLAFWQAVIVLRNLVTCLASINNPTRGRDRLIHHMLVPPLQVMMVDAMARIAGVEPAAPEPLDPLPDLPGLDILDEIVGNLPLLVDATDDPEAQTRGKRMKWLGRQLVDNLPLAPAIAAADAAEGPAATDDAERLGQLGRMARRHLLLFPRQEGMVDADFAGF
jgi:aminoglycoside phosphotransferase (APT) family kinase protein